MQEIVLSVCIPTYNGGARLKKLIRHILKTKRSDFEIVVNDNCSTDGTPESLEALGDERVRVYRNEKNVGALGNGVCALTRGRGTYLMLMIDRDVLQPEYLDAYIEFLKESKYGVLLNLCRQYDREYAGRLAREAKYYYLVKQPHPSYYTFRRSNFESVVLSEEIITNGYYPALIGIAIAQRADVYLNTVLPIVIETERQYTSMHSSRSWNVPGESKQSEDIPSFDHFSMMGYFESYLHYAMGVCGGQELRYAVNGMYAAMIENALGYIHGLESTRSKHRYQIPDWHYTMEDHIGIAGQFSERFWAYAKEHGLEADSAVIEAITEYARLQFINQTVSQMETDYKKNSEKTERLKEWLEREGISYFSGTKEDDIIFKEGIHEAFAAVNTTV